MDEYIKKNALYEKIAQLEEFSRDRYLKIPSDSPCRPRYMAELVERTYFKRIIADFPAADVAPVRHGSIIETIEDGRMKRVFSCCGTDFTGITCWMRPNYCPNCGAKIDEVNL